MRTFPFKAKHYSPLRSEYFVAALISFGSVELLFGSVTDLWLCVSPHQQIVSVFNKTEVRDYTEDCVGIKSNASCGFCDYHAISKTSSDTKGEVLCDAEVHDFSRRKEKFNMGSRHVTGLYFFIGFKVTLLNSFSFEKF